MIRQLKARPRLMLSTAFGCAVWLLESTAYRPATRFLIAWDAATALYLALALYAMMRNGHDQIRFRAAKQDEGRAIFLLLTTLSAIASLAAIVAELATAKQYSGTLKGLHIGLAGVTVLLSWSFMHMMYALHYAHEYYTVRKGDIARGLEFPDKLENPDYWDFVYHAFVIGAACATADVNITSVSMRKVATFHCIAAFFFNTTILALTVNIGAGLF